LALLLSLDRSVDAPPVDGDLPVDRPAAEAFRKLRKHLKRVDAASSDEALHELRKKGKKARYAAELAEPAAGKPGRRLVKSAKRLQDVIGEHQDAIVAEERLRAVLGRTRSKRAALAVGRLIERERSRRAEARAGLAAAKKAVARSGRRA